MRNQGEETTSTLRPGYNLGNTITLTLMFPITLNGDWKGLVANDDQGDDQLVIPPQLTIFNIKPITGQQKVKIDRSKTCRVSDRHRI